MLPVNRRVASELLLLLTAGFAMFWAILRAATQSITIDEADTYLSYGSSELSMIWYPSTNNHILNSALIWILTHVFGTSQLTVRLPALLGALLYLALCYFLCRMMTVELIPRLVLFICLAFNPFIFDYMVAARGYGLAGALLLAAIAVPVWRSLHGGPSLRTCCAVASLALGLSFTANFSFALADAAAFLAVLVWAIRRRDTEPLGDIVSYCILPGAGVAAAMCAYPLAHWRPDDSFGESARSLQEMAQSVIGNSLFQLDPSFKSLAFLKPLLVPVLAILCLCQWLATRLDGSWQRDPQTRRLGKFAAAAAGIAALTVLLHWTAFHLFKLPLPLGRKAIYLVPLTTLAAGAIAAVPPRSVTARWLHRALLAGFVCLAGYYLCCLRLTYFQDWPWGADVKYAYPILARYNHTNGITEVGTSWYYVSALNFYRVASGKETLAEFAPMNPPVAGKAVYVLNGVFDKDFLEQQKLKVVFHGQTTDVLIAVDPRRLP